MMSFRLWTIFYVFALIAAAMATFGPLGIVAAAIVLGIWAWVWYAPRQPRRPRLLDVLATILIVCVLLALLLPAVSTARGAARRSQCINNLKQIVIALLNYHDVKQAFPPPYITDANGKPMHSWRVLILPYMEELALYNKYNFNEPWDGPNNSKLADQIPDAYRCPANINNKTGNLETTYFAVVGPETSWGKSLRQFKDGTSKTIMVIEATGLGINWMEPRDVTLDEAIELLTSSKRSGHLHVDDGFFTTTYHETPFRYAAYCDGHAEWIGQLTDAEIARALFTVAGGETWTFDDVQAQGFVDPKTATVVKWGNVWGLTVFVVLSLLPAAWVRRRRRNTGEDETVARGAGDA